MTIKKPSGTRNTTLHITRNQYRLFAELTKEFGMGLTLSTAKRMGCWGGFSPWALLVCEDATDPKTQWGERALVTLARSINVDEFRAAGSSRPELDWAVLEDSEVYPFLVWHEIGHRMNNFDALGTMTIVDASVREKCTRRLTFLNEVLADRYAWERIRPGQPVARNEIGIRREDEIAETLEYLDANAPQMNKHRVRPMKPGHYKDVPDYMLATPTRAAFIGPQVDKGLLQERQAYYLNRRKLGASTPF